MPAHRKLGVIAAVAVILTVAIVAVVIAIVENDDGGGAATSGGLSEALGIVPGDATSVTFVDRAAVVKAFDLPDLRTGASEADIDGFVKKETAAGQPPLTDLDQYVVPMRDAAVSAFDVDWSAEVGVSNGAGDIYRLRDDLDLDTVADDLASAGYSRKDVDGGVELTASMQDMDPSTSLIGGKYPQTFLDVTLLPSRHLMITSMASGLSQALLATLGGADPLADSAAFRDLVSGAPLAAELDVPDCTAAFAHLSPDQRASAIARAGLDGLGTPTAIGVAITDTKHAVATLRFKDEDAADADAKARSSYLDQGSSLIAAEPMRELIDDVDVTTHGSDVEVAFAPKDRPIVTALQFSTRGPDGPIACGAS